MTISPVAPNPAKLSVLEDESGAPVFDRAGRRVAVLKYLVCDRDNSQPRYVVLSSDGFLGPGEDCRPVPAILLRGSKSRPGYALDVDRETFLAGPRHLDGDGDRDGWWSEADAYYHDSVVRSAGAREPKLVRE